MQGSRLGLNPLGEEEGGVANIFYDTLWVVLLAFCPPLTGPAEPTAQYFLERIRRTQREKNNNFDRSWTSSRTRKDKVSSILRSFNDDPKSSPFEEGWVEIEDEEG